MLFATANKHISSGRATAVPHIERLAEPNVYRSCEARISTETVKVDICLCLRTINRYFAFGKSIFVFDNRYICPLDKFEILRLAQY